MNKADIETKKIIEFLKACERAGCEFAYDKNGCLTAKQNGLAWFDLANLAESGKLDVDQIGLDALRSTEIWAWRAKLKVNPTIDTTEEFVKFAVENAGLFFGNKRIFAEIGDALGIPRPEEEKANGQNNPKTS